MSKKLLSERQIRRFAKLANLPAIGESRAAAHNYMTQHLSHPRDAEEDESIAAKDGAIASKDFDGNLKDKEKKRRDDSLGDWGTRTEDVEAEEFELDAEEGAGDLPMPDEEELEVGAGEEEEGGEMGMDLGAREELAMDVISAVADVLNIEVDIEGGEGEEVEDVEMADVDVDDEGGDIEVGAEEEEFEDVLQEALRGINYVPGKKEIVNEVAKRVAKRLLKAKRAEQQLQEALGNRTRQAPRQTRKTTAQRRTRPTRNARRKNKKMI